jgi:hypothetical protein
VLVLAWHMKATKMGYFTAAEFKQGCESLHTDTVDGLREAVPRLRRELAEEKTFREVYRFAFDWSKEHDKRYLDYETVEATLLLLLLPKYPIVEAFLKFLKV